MFSKSAFSLKSYVFNYINFDFNSYLTLYVLNKKILPFKITQYDPH